MSFNRSNILEKKRKAVRKTKLNVTVSLCFVWFWLNRADLSVEGPRQSVQIPQPIV